MKSTIRTARKSHWCVTCDQGCIQPGQRYRCFTIFPHEDFASDVAPERLNECAACAERYGRAVGAGEQQ